MSEIPPSELSAALNAAHAVTDDPLLVRKRVRKVIGLIPHDEKPSRPDPEVRPTRRVLTAAYRLRILEEIDAAPAGGKGVIERRENLWSSQISEWRKQRDNGTLGTSKRGRKGKDPVAVENEALRAENEKLKERLAVAEEIMEAQGKVSALLQQMSRKSAPKK
jgi:transposase